MMTEHLIFHSALKVTILSSVFHVAFILIFQMYGSCRAMTIFIPLLLVIIWKSDEYCTLFNGFETFKHGLYPA